MKSRRNAESEGTELEDAVWGAWSMLAYKITNSAREPTAREVEAALDEALRTVRHAMGKHHQAELLLTAEYGPRLK